MCGIAGFINVSNKRVLQENPYELMSGMLETIKHRGPDDFGMSFYGYEKISSVDNPNKVEFYPGMNCKIALGHRRLSIIDLSENGRQPMSNADDSISITYNGEIYNYIELREELSSGRKFYTQTDTEVLIASYEAWGLEMFSKIDGMFAFALFDKRRNKVLLARDMAGIKPLYYSNVGEMFIFGSEPKTVLAGLRSSGSIDYSHSAEFLIMGLTDHDDGTFYSDVKQLPGGCYMELSTSGDVKQPVRYWSPSKDLFDAEYDYSSGVENKVYLSVQRQLRADVTVGTSLSGGIDSGAIVSVAGQILKNSNKNYNTLTFSFPDFPDDESHYAKLIADNAGMKWNAVSPLMDNVSSDLEKMIEYMGEPFSTLSMFAQFKIMEAAHSRNIKVMLDGQGGDEVFLGYPRVAQRVLVDYLKEFNFYRFSKELFGLKKNASMPVYRTLMSNLFFRNPNIALKRNISRMQMYVNTDVLSNYRKNISEDVYSKKSLIETQADELTKYCLPRLLRYTDRNSMAFSVESRVPHLSKLNLDYALKLPLDWRIRNGWTKYSLRKAMVGKIPEEVIWSTQKKGFPVPQKFWVEKLRDDIFRILSSRDDLVNIIDVDKIISAIDNGKGNEAYLWRAISFGMWICKMDVKI
jgi:asparagine synthase (glutamine-hydrolysing)